MQIVDIYNFESTVTFMDKIFHYIILDSEINSSYIH